MVEFKLLLIILAVAGLFFVIIAFFLGTKIGKLSASRYLTKEIKIAREDAVKRSRGVLNGQFSEQMANRSILSRSPASQPEWSMRSYL